MDHSEIYTPIVFGGAAPSVPSFIGQRSYFGSHSSVRYFGGNLTCTLQATFLDIFLSNLEQLYIIVKSPPW